MQNITRETLTIESIGKYGPRANGQYFSWSNKSGLSNDSVKVGQTYDVLIYQTPGKKTRYINQIVGEAASAPARTLEAKAHEQSATAVEAPKAGGIAGKPAADKEAYWAAKNDSQKLGGLFHDAAQITAAVAMSGGYDVPKALAAFEEVLNGVIAVRSKLD